MKFSDNIKGAILISTSMAAYVTNDALMKLSAESLDLPQAIFIRGIFASVIIFFMSKIKVNIKLRDFLREWKLFLYRIVGEIGSTFCFLHAIFNMPLANATAILQSLPMAITLGAIIFFGERVGHKRWVAIIIGFAGVLLIIRPGSDGFNEFSFYAVLAVAFIVIRDLVTRKISSKVPSNFISLMSAVVITISGGLLIPFSGWHPVSEINIYYLGGAALLLSFGSLFNIMTMRVGEVSFTAPFRYTLLLWATLLGGLLFNELPDLITILGSLIVVSSGIYMIKRENYLKQRYK